jgi:hypothetical protein
MYVLATAMRNAGKDLTSAGLIDALEHLHDYRVGPIASPRTFTTVHHIGNLRLQPMQVRNGEWVQVPWESKRPSDILERYH